MQHWLCCCTISVQQYITNYFMLCVIYIIYTYTCIYNVYIYGIYIYVILYNIIMLILCQQNHEPLQHLTSPQGASSSTSSCGAASTRCCATSNASSAMRSTSHDQWLRDTTRIQYITFYICVYIYNNNNNQNDYDYDYYYDYYCCYCYYYHCYYY